MQEVEQAIADLPAFYSTNMVHLPRTIHMEWCICKVQDFKVLNSAQVIINPGVPIDAATVD